MFICLDSAPELLSQPCVEKQVFAVDMVSHLSVMWSLPKSLSYARLCINSLSTLLGVLATQQRRDLMESVLPALVRICSAFPPLLEDCLQLLVLASNMFSATSADNHAFRNKVIQTFENILSKTVQSKAIF